MSSSPFTRCPRCGQETARPVEVCIKCGHSAGVRHGSGSAGSAFGYLIVFLILGSLGFAAWWFLFARPSPLVGSWTKGKITLTFERDGDLHANAMFRPDGTFVFGTTRTTSRWRAAGSRVSITPEGKGAAPRDVEWAVRGDTLTLKGVDKIGTIKSTVTLKRNGAARS